MTGRLLMVSAVAAFGVGIVWLFWGMGTWHGVRPGYYAGGIYVWSEPVYPPVWYFIILGVLFAWGLVGSAAGVLWEVR